MKLRVLLALALMATVSLTASYTFASPLYSTTVLADNPISYWRLGESSGTTATDEQGTKNGTYVGPPTLGVPGAIVDDSDTAIGLGSPSNTHVIMSSFTAFPTTAISVEFWMKSSDATTSGTPFSYAVGGTDNEFLLYDYNSFAIYINGVAVGTGVKGNDGAYNHIVTTWRSSDGALKVYKNGVLAFSGTHQTGAPISSGGALVLGQEQDSVGGAFDPGQRFVGSLDEVAVYGTVLSADRVLAHYETGTAPGVAPIPEPSTLALLSLAIVGLLGLGRLHKTGKNNDD